MTAERCCLPGAEQLDSDGDRDAGWAGPLSSRPGRSFGKPVFVSLAVSTPQHQWGSEPPGHARRTITPGDLTVELTIPDHRAPRNHWEVLEQMAWGSATSGPTFEGLAGPSLRSVCHRSDWPCPSSTLLTCGLWESLDPLNPGKRNGKSCWVLNPRGFKSRILRHWPA